MVTRVAANAPSAWPAMLQAPLMWTLGTSARPVDPLTPIAKRTEPPMNLGEGVGPVLVHEVPIGHELDDTAPAAK
jgi:hypothetical protein